ncbi:hypothetical protein PK35_11710 [Tamlana nanhaiensis]|uniref:DUF3325 domain-containing protein n=1 Tax=Neotamlana nanhaiensis TaxID=1382798 RepID=A0A0D7W2L8_9FLAO|nr:hypothetical protein [Tamlana nanhaiensis]KJD32097.1 hypothetical protein PK35_10825 [Tamlana nanhaiensis]KJD32259.1 hypothetical protein PK35_11710 [Tamlana nanhaiensis]
MITIALFLNFLAFYVLYNTTKRVVITPHLGFEKHIQQNIKSSKIIGLMLLLIALVFNVISFGLGVGTLFFFIVLMTFGSLVILLAPLKLINTKTLVLFFIATLILELLFV